MERLGKQIRFLSKVFYYDILIIMSLSVIFLDLTMLQSLQEHFTAVSTEILLFSSSPVEFPFNNALNR